MKTMILTSLVLLGLIGCASSESQLKEALRKNPQIVFSIIEENPEQFLETVNRAVQKAQQLQGEKREAQIKAEQEKDLQNPKQPVLSPERRLSGNDKGKIVLVEYGDFQCPACGMGYAALKKFKEKYKDQVQFYFKNMPLSFHKMAYPSALYFEAIRLQDRNKAYKFYDLIFQNQKELDQDFLKKTATQVGADLKRVEADSQSEKVKKIVADDMDEFEKMGFTGTPVTLINGVALNGAQPFEELEKILQRIQRK